MHSKEESRGGPELPAELGNTVKSIDWEQHLYGRGVLCEFRPRNEFNGRPIKRGLAEKVGLRFMLCAQWAMSEDDGYPGEYALSTSPTSHAMFDALGIGWVASGDVFVLHNV